MDVEKTRKGVKYLPKICTALCFPLLLLAALFLFFGRNFEAIRIASLMQLLPGCYHHISNFSISFMVYITFGYIGLMVGMSVMNFTVMGVFIALANIIVECCISIINTPDKIDAVYGLSAVLLGWLFLFIAKQYGMKKNEAI